jgi:hypothetical protein
VHQPSSYSQALKPQLPEADKETVSVTLSPPVRIFAFAGVLVALGLAVFFFLVGRTAGETAANTPLVTNEVTTNPSTPRTPAARPARTPRATQLPPSGFPLPVHRALRRNRVVVVVVYMPGASVDAVVRAEARAGARSGGAAYVPMSALSGRLMQPLVAKTGVLPNPAVVVVKRPGVVTATLGVTDRQTVAQAVVQARR